MLPSAIIPGSRLLQVFFTKQANCLVTYAQPAQPITAPTVTVDTSGC